jgi:hypothetical protein
VAKNILANHILALLRCGQEDVGKNMMGKNISRVLQNGF